MIKNNTMLRLYLVAALVPLTYGVARLVQVGLEPPEVEMPSWTFDELPLQLEGWTGKQAELEPELAAASGAAHATNRIYQNATGYNVSLYTATFNNPALGVLHSPMNCYRQTGWLLKNETREYLQLSDGLTIPVSCTTWERRGEKVVVVYWYQLGEHVLFGRWDLGLKVRWSLRNRPKWPAIIKVMLHLPAIDVQDAKVALLGFAKQVAAWENQPSHRQEMLGIASK